MDISSEMVRTLYEIGTMAAWRGEVFDAVAILGGVQCARPDNAYPQLGIAVAYMNEGRYGPAMQIMEAAYKKNPGCDQTAWHRALACKLAGYEDLCQKLCRDILDAERDSQAMEIAAVLIAIPAGAVPQLSSVG